MLPSSTFSLPGELRQRFSGTSAGTFNAAGFTIHLQSAFNAAGFTIHLQVHSMQQDSQQPRVGGNTGCAFNAAGLKIVQAWRHHRQMWNMHTMEYYFIFKKQNLGPKKILMSGAPWPASLEESMRSRFSETSCL